MKKRFFVVAAAFFGSQAIFGQSTQDTTVLDEAIVTAGKFEQKQSQTGKVVTVITREQLEKNTGKTLAQILNEQVGLAIAGAYTANGGVQTVFMRGASAGRTLILIDGIPVGDPSNINSEFDINLFSINDIERIEICKGAQSTLYGSDAIGGAINIITTKKDITKPFGLKVTTSFGNKNTFRSNLQGYGKIGKFSYTARFAKLNTDGFSAARDTTGTKGFDKDGYSGNVINAAVQYQFTSSLMAKAFIQNNHYKADVDAGVFSDDRDFTIDNRFLNTGAGLYYKKGIVSITANYQHGELSRKYLNDSLYPRNSLSFTRNNYSSRTQYAELYSTITAAKWLTVLAGIDYRWAVMDQHFFSVSSFGPYESAFGDTSMHQLSGYASLFISDPNKKVNVEIGARYNDHSRYGHNSTYTFNPSYLFSKHFRVFASIASGFKAPSIYQLFDTYSGNADLGPEKSTSYEIGIQQTHEKIKTRVVYFHRDIDNGIDYNYTSFKYYNFVTQKVSGTEIELSFTPTKKLNFTTNYTYLNGDEETQNRKTNGNDTVYNYLLRRPAHTLNMNLGYQFTPKFYASISGKSVSKRNDIGGYLKPDVSLDGYFLLGAYASYQCKKQLKFFVDAQNLTNKKFDDIRGYNSVPFLCNAGISFEL